MTDEELLNNLMYIKHNYDSIDNLHKKAKAINPNIKRKFVSEWMSKQQSVQMNNNKIQKKEFKPIYSETPYSFQLDLTFLPRYKKQNDGYYVLFTAININSRYAYAYFSKDKKMDTILNFLKDMEKKTVINNLTMDEGTEFTNNEFQNFCKDNEIKLYFVKDDSHKLGILNRFHRTLKDKLTKYFSAHNTTKWIDVIDTIVNNYNHTINRGIGTEPYKVNTFIENNIIQKAKNKTEEIENNEEVINIGDYCRVKLIKTTFGDKLQSKFSSELYKIIKIGKNTIKIIDDDDKEYTVKKSNIKIVVKPTKITVLNERLKANVQNTINRRINKEGISNENIIDTKRINYFV
jgi:hypothetical protein